MCSQLPDDVYRRLYASEVASSQAWTRKAEQLLVAASLLEPHVVGLWQAYRDKFTAGKRGVHVPTDVQGVYFVLVAYAVENLCKAVLVRKRSVAIRREVETRWTLPSELKTHDLVALTAAVGVSPSLEDEDLLRRLTRNAVWAGRYPVPTSADKRNVAEVFTGGTEYHVAYFGGSDCQRIKEFIDGIRRHLGV